MTEKKQAKKNAPEHRLKIVSKYDPAGDQPTAIKALVKGLSSKMTGFGKVQRSRQTLLGVTGSGKTFTIANVIEKVQKPTLVIAHNKTLAAQLASEFKEFFPNNAVHYFVSYYDYYQPEAYMPITDTYIEKEAVVNEEIDRLRHAATQSLLTRDDVIIVASVSAIYGIGNPAEYAKVILRLEVGATESRTGLLRQLIEIYFTRTTADLTQGSFRALCNTIEIHPSHEQIIYRLIFAGTKIARIELLDPITRELKEEVQEVIIFPAKHFVTPQDQVERAVKDIKTELEEQLKYLKKKGLNLEAERLSRRVRQDIAMIKEIGYCNGIENYSRHFDGRKAGEPAHSLLSYFFNEHTGSKREFLTVIDESHVTLPQVRAMYAGDQARKNMLIEHGFRLPSARDNRPMQFTEFDERVSDMIFVSATPGDFEIEESKKYSSNCNGVIEQVVRPTGLLDPEISVRPVTVTAECDDKGSTRTPLNVKTSKVCGQVKDVMADIEVVTKRGARTLVTVLTKKMAEDLTDFLREKKIKTEYIHSDVKTFERIEIMRQFREGEFDVLVGVNLLREGLDLPEVELVAILDADKEGFLRSETSLVQTMGRAARNVSGRVTLYADKITGSMERAINETNRRRAKQSAYNKKHGITPQSVQSAIKTMATHNKGAHAKAVHELVVIDRKSIKNKKDLEKIIKKKRAAMLKASKEMDFETAALVRDEIKELEESYAKEEKEKLKKAKKKEVRK